MKHIASCSFGKDSLAMVLMHNMDAEELAAFLSKTFCQSLGKTQLLEWLNKEVPNETL